MSCRDARWFGPYEAHKCPISPTTTGVPQEEPLAEGCEGFPVCSLVPLGSLSGSDSNYHDIARSGSSFEQHLAAGRRQL
jgi:hypothetical protein